jgi:hypothetical protein
LIIGEINNDYENTQQFWKGIFSNSIPQLFPYIKDKLANEITNSNNDILVKLSETLAKNQNPQVVPLLKEIIINKYDNIKFWINLAGNPNPNPHENIDYETYSIFPLLETILEEIENETNSEEIEPSFDDFELHDFWYELASNPNPGVIYLLERKIENYINIQILDKYLDVTECFIEGLAKNPNLFIDESNNIGK